MESILLLEGGILFLIDLDRSCAAMIRLSTALMAGPGNISST